MTIADLRGKCNAMLTRTPRDVVLVSILILSCGLSFYLGVLTGKDMGQGSEAPLSSSPLPSPATSPQIVASKFGTKYYLTSCASSNRISPSNKLFFATAAAAEAAGYTKAGNCPGL